MAPLILFDTDVLIDFLRGRARFIPDLDVALPAYREPPGEQP